MQFIRILEITRDFDESQNLVTNGFFGRQISAWKCEWLIECVQNTSGYSIGTKKAKKHGFPSYSHLRQAHFSSDSLESKISKNGYDLAHIELIRAGEPDYCLVELSQTSRIISMRWNSLLTDCTESNFQNCLNAFKKVSKVSQKKDNPPKVKQFNIFKSVQKA